MKKEAVVKRTLFLALMLAAAPAVRADSGSAAGPEPSPTPTPAVAAATTQEAAAKAEAKPRLDIYGFAMLDMGYQSKQNDPNWFDVLRPTKLPAYANQYGEDGHFFAGVRQSRLGVKGFMPTDLGEIKTIFEFELFGTGVDAGAEELELEDGLDLAEVGGHEALHSEAALADSGEDVAVLAVLVRVGRQLDGPQHVVPVRVVLLGLVAHVEHAEAVDVEARLGLGLGGGLFGGGCGGGRRLRRRAPARVGPQRGRASQQYCGQEQAADARGRGACGVRVSHDSLLELTSD